MPRRICLSIGVGNVTPRSGGAARFAYLDGAPLAADAMGQWALSSGFGADNVRIVTDQPLPDGTLQPVTTDRVQRAVNALFPEDGAQTDHLILSFCGHGLTALEVGSAFWLFSDSLENQYRVNVDEFISELLTFGVKRISLISDACRDAPRDLDLLRLESRRGIVGRQAENDSPMFDRLAACQDGKRSYMLVDRTSAAPGKCILSGVVLDVLWGNEPDAFRNNVINTHSFGVFTRARAAERAKQYGYELHPQCTVDPEAALLVDGAAKPTPVPDLPPWPPVARATSMGAIEEGIAPAPASTLTIELLRSDKAFRDRMLGNDFGTSHPDLASSAGFIDLPEGASNLVDDLVALRHVQGAANVDVDGDISSTISALEGVAARHARAAAAATLSVSLNDVQNRRISVDQRLIVPGGNVQNMWREGTNAVVEFVDGTFVPVCLYPDLCAVVVRGPDGRVVIAYAARGDGDVLAQSATAIHELTLGTLDSSRIADVAARIRQGKHANPVLGAIAAYLYRQVSDFDNLRRMAYYYVDHKQPIPFDIALLGQMEVYAEGGNYFAKVPAVPRRQHEGDNRNPLPDYTTRETRAVTGPLAGRCPWLTLGWDYPPAERFRDRIYAEYRAHAGLFRSSSFTSVGRELGELLVRAWNLRRW